jgi:hypothetical protein
MIKKILISVIGLVMIGLLLYPPLISCRPGDSICLYLHKPIWEDWYTIGDPRVHIAEGSRLFMYQADLTRLALYELALAGVGALIHFVTRR